MSDRYYQINGESLPSVTTILSFKTSDAVNRLMGWSVKVEREYFKKEVLKFLESPLSMSAEEQLAEIEKSIRGVKRSDREAKRAANIGTGTHKMCEWRLKFSMGEWLPEPQIGPESRIGYEAFLRWLDEISFKPTHSEVVVHSLEDGYAGTVDAIGTISGYPALVDFKTSKAVWPEAFLQTAAYAHAATKMGLCDRFPQCYILRLPKTIEDPEFECVQVDDLDSALDAFMACKKLWMWHKGIEKVMSV